MEVLRIGRVGDGKARGKVVLLLWPEAGLVVVGTGGRELQVLLIDLALLSGSFALQIPSVRIDGGRDLLAMVSQGVCRMVWRTPSVRVRFGPNAPGILDVPLKLVGLEVAVR